jgi:histidinol dehydrogenase
MNSLPQPFIYSKNVTALFYFICMKQLKPIPIVRYNSASGKALLTKILSARTSRNAEIQKVVAEVLSAVAKKGDSALFAYTQKFEGRSVSAKTVRISAAHIREQAKRVEAPLKNSIREAARQIHAYHAKQKPAGYSLRTPYAMLSQRILPLKRVGLYVPGGKSPYPSSVLMNAIPAQIAGVREIAVVTPCGDALDPAIAFAFELLGITEAFRIGGCQAIAALAYGTKSIHAVDKIVGPGNAYVATAKKLVYGTVDIDSIAGPSEVAIIADSSTPARWAALDMLAQAEHGSGDETAVCVTENAGYAQKIAECLAEEMAKSPKRDVFLRLKPGALSVFVTSSREQSIAFVNSLAPEHLQIMTKNAKKDALAIENSGAVFLGKFTPVALGDYFVGTNHVLPTGGSARFASGLGVLDFCKRISVAETDSQGLKKAAGHVSRFARAERFIHHAMSVEERAAGRE